MLVKRYEDIENLKELFGKECMDYNLVFASSCGRPIEGQVINRALAKLIPSGAVKKIAPLLYGFVWLKNFRMI